MTTLPQILLETTLRGAAVVALVWVFDGLFGRWFAARHRRLAWIVAGLAFLVPVIWKPAVLPPRMPPPPEASPFAPPVSSAGTLFQETGGRAPATGFVLLSLWAAGVLVSGSLLAWRTLGTAREWHGVRFSTDAGLLGQVEDCRALAGISAPVGAIVSERIATPALLGWLRPRLLLPSTMIRSAPPEQMRHILLHELAHHRSADLAMGWIFAVARVLHWFNPAVHLAARRWRAAIEEAADDRAVRWSGAASGTSYAETLLALAKSGRVGRSLGALSISESLRSLQHRITMIQHHPRRTVSAAFAGILLAALAAFVFIRPIHADPDQGPEDSAKTAAVAAMEQWLSGIDSGDYAASWKDASKLFRVALTEGQWIQALDVARKPLGALEKRELASAVYETEIPNPLSKDPLKGEFVIAQFRTSFEDLRSAVETVTFERESDGKWRASGYFVAPGL